MKKRLSLLLILCLVCFSLPAVADAPLVEPSGCKCYWNDGAYELGPRYEDIRWTSCESGDQHGYVLLDDGTAEIVDMTYYGYWIPETVDGIPVTAIGTLGICDRMDYPSELEIPAWITQISENVLRWAYDKNLFVSVDPANSCFSFENGILFDLRNHCLLAYLENDSCVFPADTEQIGCRAFEGCGFDRIELPDGLTRIGDFAFEGCGSLTAIAIPDSITDIGDNPFIHCGSLTDIAISPDHPLYGFRDGILYRKTDMQIICVLPAYAEGGWTMPEWAMSLGPYALSGITGLTEVRLHNGLTEIPQGTFLDCYDLTAIQLPDGIETIGAEAFSHCISLAEIDIPGSVRKIGLVAFAGCWSLKEVRFAEGPAEIRDAAFSRCEELRTVVLPRELISIGSSAFFECHKLEEMAIPDSVTAIGYGAFSGCRSLTVTAGPDSTAAQYCLENHIPCVFSVNPE